MTPEGRVKDKIKRVLRQFGSALYWHCPVQNGMGEPSLDFIGCINGFFFSIEAKRPGAKPTVRQQLTMSQMRAAGAFVFFVSTDDELMRLEATLYLLAP